MSTKPVTAPTKAKGSALNRWIKANGSFLAPFGTLAILVLFFSIFSEGGHFFTPINFRNILQQSASLSLLTVGVTFVLLAGEIDLSIASMATMTGVIASYLLVVAKWPSIAAVLVAFLAGVALGWFNGFFTTRFGLPSFITTLAMMQICAGVALYLTRARPFFDVPEVSSFLGGGYIGPVPVILLVSIVALAAGHFVLIYTRFGRYIYMVGGNKEAAELAGVNSKLIRLLAIMTCGAVAGFGGIVNTGRIGSAQVGGFDSMQMDAIAAVVLGGTSLFGGVGGIPNTIIGLLIFGVLKNGLNQVNIDIYLKTFVTGLTLLAALLVNVYTIKLSSARAAVED
jgi:ribose transport system permease protein